MVLPPLKLWFNWHLEGLENVPTDGPALVAGNHISYLDPFADAHFLLKRGRRPRFLAKSDLFENVFPRTALQGCRQIPVERGTGHPAPVRAAVAALRMGECVAIYPEGTVTENPDFSPMQGRTGIARLAIAAGVPVIPLAIWGSQHVWQKQGKGSLKFARPIWLRAGAPIDVSAHGEDPEDPDTLAAVVADVMAELSHIVDDLRARYPKRWG